jgi:hypothetical protein
MLPNFDEFELTESALRHGFDEIDVADMLRRPKLVIRSRRRAIGVYEIFGRNREGAYLLAVGRLIEYNGVKVLLIFHINRMTDAERGRYLRQVRER